MLCLFNIILTITSFSKQTSEPFTLSTNIFHPSYITVLVLYSSAIFSCKINCKVGMDTSRAVCAYSLRTIFCKHATFFIAGKVWRCSVHVSRFIQSTGYSWRSNIWSKEKLHKENGQKICCYCGFESTDELGACRRYVVFIKLHSEPCVKDVCWQCLFRSLGSWRSTILVKLGHPVQYPYSKKKLYCFSPSMNVFASDMPTGKNQHLGGRKYHYCPN